MDGLPVQNARGTEWLTIREHVEIALLQGERFLGSFDPQKEAALKHAAEFDMPVRREAEGPRTFAFEPRR
jgi:hypothetical protein